MVISPVSTNSSPTVSVPAILASMRAYGATGTAAHHANPIIIPDFAEYFNTDDGQSIQGISPGQTALIGGGIGLGALLLAMLPEMIRNAMLRKELNDKEIEFANMLKNPKPMTAEEFEALRAKAEEIFARLEQSDGREWLAKQPFMKHFKELHPNKDNWKAFQEEIYKNLSMYCAQIAEGMINTAYIDADGNIVFKDFANRVSNAEENAPSQDVLALNAMQAYANRERGIFQAVLEGKIDPSKAKLAERMIRLYKMGVFKSGNIAENTLESFFQVWEKNEKKYFRLPPKEQLEYLLKSPNIFINSARIAALANSSQIAIPEHSIFGIGKDGSTKNMETLGGISHIFGRDGQRGLDHRSFPVNANGMSGPVVRDGEIIFPGIVFNPGNAQLLKDIGLPELFDNARVKEVKGMATEHSIDMFRDVMYYAHGENQASANAELQARGENPAEFRKNHPEKLPHLRVPFRDMTDVMDIMAQGLTDMAERKESGKSTSEVWDTILEQVRPVDKAYSEALMVNPLHIVQDDAGRPIPITTDERITAIEGIDRGEGDKQTYVSRGLYKRLEEAKAQGASIETLKEISQHVRQIDPFAVTIHTITAALEGVYADREQVEKLMSGHSAVLTKNNANFDEGLIGIEFMKAEKLAEMLQAGESDAAQRYFEGTGALAGKKVLVALDMGPASPRLVNPQALADGRNQAVVSPVDNSASMPLANLKIYIDGVEKVTFPFNAYLEFPLAPLDKGAGEAIMHWLSNLSMQGDSPGSDRRAHAKNALMRLFGVNQRVTRNMIDESLMKDAFFEQLHMHHGDNLKHINAAEGQARAALGAHGTVDNAVLSAAREIAVNQLLSNPLRYEEVFIDSSGKEYRVDLTSVNGLSPAEQLNGKKNDEGTVLHRGLRERFGENGDLRRVYRFVGHGADTIDGLDKIEFETEEEIRSALGDWLELFYGRVIRNDDTSHNVRMQAMVAGMVHGNQDELTEAFKNLFLSEGMLDTVGGTRNMNHSGMPGTATIGDSDWQPQTKNTRSVYHPGNRVWNEMIRTYPKLGMAGGLAGMVFGLGAGVYSMHRIVSHKRDQKQAAMTVHNATQADDSNGFTINLGLNSAPSHNRAFRSSQVGNISFDFNFDQLPESDNQSSAELSSWRQFENVSLIGLNTGMFMLNSAWLIKSIFNSVYPQPFMALGAGLNLVGLALPQSMQLPTFVLSSALNMGGWALLQSQMDRAWPDPVWPDQKSYNKIFDAKWDSKKEFMHAYYMHGGKGCVHLAYPGFVAAGLRKQYDKDVNVLEDKGVPRPFAHLWAGTKQLSVMNWKMLKDPLGYGYDMLRPMARKEFVRGNRYVMPNSRSHILALGAAVPVVGLVAAGAYKGIKRLTGNVKEEDPSMPLADRQDQSHVNAMELAANVSAIAPAASQLIYSIPISNAAFGNPFNVVPTGLNMQHAITPRLNGRLIQIGGIGSILATSASALSSAGIAPAWISSIANPLYMGLTSISSIGLIRNLFELEFNPVQNNHFCPKQGPTTHAIQKGEAIARGWLPADGNTRHGNLGTHTWNLVKYLVRG